MKRSEKIEKPLKGGGIWLVNLLGEIKKTKYRFSVYSMIQSL